MPFAPGMPVIQRKSISKIVDSERQISQEGQLIDALWIAA
jgi:hypothetical protein